MGFNLIGIVGPIACGKGVVVDYLKEQYGYNSFSLSSILHDELKKRGITVFTRATLQDMGDEMRKKEGEGVLAKRAIEQLNKTDCHAEFISASQKRSRNEFGMTAINTMKTNQKIIIEGIRNPGEVKYLRTIPGFYLIAIDASQDIRYQRVLKRGKPWDPKDRETFLHVDGRDGGDRDKTNGQQVRKCMKMADVQLQNNTNLSHLYVACQRLVAEWE